ncbi:hypothetical protein BT93_B2647 [Corymbia citriodora subsp. variegata]|nr:hypothetical protein BT93_B2647 [Corymbia citriodora subsp. variegata]
MSDLEAIDEILGAVKPRRERPLPSGSDLSTPGAVDRVRAKWEELCQLTKEGYSQIASNSNVEDRIKNLLAELSSDIDCFAKTPEFQYDCEEFAGLFADGVEVFRQNCNKIESSTSVEESFKKLEDRLETGKKILKEHRSSYQAAQDKKVELMEEKERLEALLAEVEHQIEHNNIHIRHERRSMKQQLSEVQATMQECDRQRAEVERHLSIKRKCMEDNETLDEHLSTFRSSVKRRLDSARQDSSSKADPQVDLQDCQMSIEEHSQIVPNRTPELFFPEASEPRPCGLLIRLAEMSMAVFARCFCC